MRVYIISIFENAISSFVNQVLNGKPIIVMLKSVGGRVDVNFWFPDDNLGLIWPIKTKLSVRVAYVKRQLEIAT